MQTHSLVTAARPTGITTPFGGRDAKSTMEATKAPLWTAGGPADQVDARLQCPSGRALLRGRERERGVRARSLEGTREA
eukprot:3714600-Lingulodinium_polyedra.AAC.1